VGNASYAEAPLKNPVNDARAMAAKLRELGFEVTNVENATLIEIRTALTQFADALDRTPGASALFHFAGHGIQARGSNYLMLVDAPTGFEPEARAGAMELELVLRELRRRGDGANLIILDACRNNPFDSAVRDRSRGLAPVQTVQLTPPHRVAWPRTAMGKMASIPRRCWSRWTRPG
jgi:uncharacterized caspase-like protein